MTMSAGVAPGMTASARMSSEGFRSFHLWSMTAAEAVRCVPSTELMEATCVRLFTISLRKAAIAESTVRTLRKIWLLHSRG